MSGLQVTTAAYTAQKQSQDENEDVPLHVPSPYEIPDFNNSSEYQGKLNCR